MNGESDAISVSKTDELTTKRTNGNGWLSTEPEWKIMAHTYNGTHLSHKLFLNGVELSLSKLYDFDKDPGSLNLSTSLYIGMNTDQEYGINAYISEFMVYGRSLSSIEIKGVMNYLNNKYEIY